MAEQAPSIGRIVHFMYGNQHCAAIITDPEWENVIGSEGVVLVVFRPNQEPFTTTAAHDEAHADATWHWPEYVKA